MAGKFKYLKKMIVTITKGPRKGQKELRYFYKGDKIPGAGGKFNPEPWLKKGAATGRSAAVGAKTEYGSVLNAFGPATANTAKRTAFSDMLRAEMLPGGGNIWYKEISNSKVIKMAKKAGLNNKELKAFTNNLQGTGGGGYVGSVAVGTPGRR